MGHILAGGGRAKAGESIYLSNFFTPPRPLHFVKHDSVLLIITGQGRTGLLFRTGQGRAGQALFCRLWNTSLDRRASDNVIHSNTRPNTANHTKYGIWGAHLSALNMVEWGIPEKILQNAVQSRRF